MRIVRPAILNSLLILFAFVAFFVAGEAAIRLYRAYTARHEPGNRSKQASPLELDPKLGWRSCAHYVGTWPERDAQGRERTVRYETGEYGFRMFGNPQTAKVKVLVIGDSCTQARYVSNDETFYARVAQALPIEIFAYGCGGYGSLQEYMVLDQYVDFIDPAIILWQYSGNDIINNSYELERSSYINNNGMRRPYLTETGEIAYLYPSNVPLMRRLASESQFLMFVFSRLDKLGALISGVNASAAPKLETVETAIERSGPGHPGFRKAVQLTDAIMKRVRARCHARIITFTIAESFYVDEFRKISERNGMEFLGGVQEEIKASEAQGLCTRASDNVHWNEPGHRIVGRKIVEYLSSTDMGTRSRYDP